MDLRQGQESGNLTEITAVESSHWHKQTRDTVSADVGVFLIQILIKRRGQAEVE